MDDRRFDSVARMFASGASRRAALKGLLGIGGIAVAGLARSDSAEAARRGYSGPISTVLRPPVCVPDGDPCTDGPESCCAQQCCYLIHTPNKKFCCSGV